MSANARSKESHLGRNVEFSYMILKFEKKLCTLCNLLFYCLELLDEVIWVIKNICYYSGWTGPQTREWNTVFHFVSACEASFDSQGYSSKSNPVFNFAYLNYKQRELFMLYGMIKDHTGRVCWWAICSVISDLSSAFVLWGCFLSIIYLLVLQSSSGGYG